LPSEDAVFFPPRTAITVRPLPFPAPPPHQKLTTVNSKLLIWVWVPHLIIPVISSLCRLPNFPLCAQLAPVSSKETSVAQTTPLRLPAKSDMRYHQCFLFNPLESKPSKLGKIFFVSARSCSFFQLPPSGFSSNWEVRSGL